MGRLKELDRFLESVTKACRLPAVEALFFRGKRDIGKSSLCRVAARAAERDLQVLPLHVFLGGVASLEEMVRRVFQRLLDESYAQPWHKAVESFFGKHVRKVGLFGLSVEFQASKQDLERAVSDFVPALRNLLQKLGSARQGLLLILDDINGLAGDDRFANWLKSTVDEMATAREPLPFTLVLVGLPERRGQLMARQPSLSRVFQLVHITRFTREETREFYERTFSKVDVQVAEEAHEVLWKYSGGFPVFMHEIGDCTYRVDEDNRIDEDDAWLGVVRATEVIGAKYIEPKVMAAIRSERYRDILRFLVRDGPRSEFRRQEVLGALPAGQQKVFDNFVRRMRQLGVLRLNREKGAGCYEFTSEVYPLFFWLQSLDKRR